jgi:dTDP-4-amino-4,6-dideoxy-D-galactose acyltransferase
VDASQYQPLPWDSEFFGVPIGRMHADAADLEGGVAAADAAGIRCLYLLAPAAADERIALAIELGFRPYDIRVELERAVERSAATPDGVHEPLAADVPALERLAREQIDGTRFFADPHFPRERCRELYATWLRRGLADEPDRVTLVAGEADGFILCRLDRSTRVGAIELIVVAREATGRGVGARLLGAAHAAFAAAGLRRAEVVTQGRNIPAQRLYQSKGYRTAVVSIWLHRWREPD